MSSQPIPSPPLSTTSSPSPRRSIPDEDNRPAQPSPTKSEFPSDPPPPPPPPPPPTRSPAFPNREDCWSEEATRTLIDAWGDHYLQLNRGNLRQKHWQEVADAVNALHATTAKLRRTDVQCKNRIDTTKKKFKIEKSRFVQSNGRYVSTWTHFESLDQLIGESFSKIASSNSNGHSRSLRRRVSPSPESSPSPPRLPEAVRRNRKNDLVRDPDTSPLLKLPPAWSVPVGPRSKRSGAGSVTERNFSVMAAAAAAMEAEDDDDDDDFEDDSDTWGRRLRIGGRKRKRPSEEDGMIVGDGYMRLAEAIGRLGQIYRDVEEAKQRQLVELEKQRMQFAKDLEIQRMKVFMESQVHLEKLKQANRNSEHSKSLRNFGSHEVDDSLSCG